MTTNTLRHAVQARRERAASRAARAVAAVGASGSTNIEAQLQVEEAFRDLREYRDLDGLVRDYADACSPYQRGGVHSILLDLGDMHTGAVLGASERMTQHRTVVPAFAEERAIGTGALVGLTVPQYIVDDAAPAARAESPLFDLLAKPMPEHGLELDVLTWATPASAEAQSSQNTTLTESAQSGPAAALPVLTYDARMDASVQLMERARAGVDAQVLPDMVAAVDVKADTDIITGPGTSGRITGILSTGSVGSGTYTDGTPTVAEFIPILEGAYRTSAAARGAPPNLAVMHSRRWSWFRQGLAVESGAGGAALLSAPQIPQAVATYGQDLQIIVDNGVPTNLGAGTNEDRVIIARQDVLDLYAAPQSVTLEAVQGSAAALKRVVVVYRYVAFTAARLPASVVVIGGTGLVTPS